MFEKIALVTGASRGIGRACAISIAKSGIYVIGTATTRIGAKKISEEFEDMNLKGCGKILNVNSFSSVKNLFKMIHREYSTFPNILVNNAGITNDSTVINMDLHQWKSVVETNLNSVFYTTKASIYGMVKKKWGRIINISSICGLTGNVGQTNYSTAKLGIIGFTRSLAMEIGRFGITANVVAPGFIDTDMIKDINSFINCDVIKNIPLRRIGKVQDVANAVQFLISEDSSYITGQTININGGSFMN